MRFSLRLKNNWLKFLWAVLYWCNMGFQVRTWPGSSDIRGHQAAGYIHPHRSVILILPVMAPPAGVRDRCHGCGLSVSHPRISRHPVVAASSGISHLTSLTQTPSQQRHRDHNCRLMAIVCRLQSLWSLLQAGHYTMKAMHRSCHRAEIGDITLG